MIGDVLGKYRVIGKLGQGGMAEVYGAEHTLLGGYVAIKVLHRSVSRQQSVVKRLFNEARITATLGHPGIVKTFDFGRCPDDRPYLVMEYLDGESLAQRLRRERRLPVTRALDCVRQLASALEVAHGAAVIHRDLTPANIFLVVDAAIPGGERARILDFGIAKNIGGDRTATREGVILGTPHYMSPEQCRGRRDIDHRSDLYSLGCILYRVVTGRTVFVERNKHKVMAYHRDSRPDQPRAVVPDLPIEVNALIMRLLAKNPADRLDSAGALIAALDRIMGQLELGRRAITSGPVPARALTTGRVPARPMTSTSAGSGAVAGAVSVGIARNKPETPWAWSSGALPRARAPLPSYRKAAVALGGVALGLIVGGSLLAWQARPAAGPSARVASAHAATGRPAPAASDREQAGEGPAGEMAAPPARPAPTRRQPVRIVITSQPPAADVYQMPESVRIGTTPLALDRAPLAGELVLYLRKPGYRDASLVADANTSGIYRAELARRSRPEKPQAGSRDPRRRQPR